ncbi:Bromodomain-containing protein [Backusella circina FSU 941]|nr:Bromodomain-containing protein [Backusella circina FSU 941]
MVPESNNVSMLLSDKNFCLKIVKALLRTQNAGPFKEPVDPVYFNIPDYFDVVKNPMDLGTAQKKLENNQYQSIDDFINDINLVFENCYLYNNETDPVCNDARVLEGIFKKLIARSKDSGNISQPKPKKAPVKTVPRPVTPVSNVSSNDDENRSDVWSDFDDELSAKHVAQQNELFDDIFGHEELSEEENIEEENRGRKRAIDEEEEEKRDRKRASVDVEDEMTGDQKKRCAAIIHELKKAKYDDITWAFKAPVDPNVWGCHDYYDVVKYPMDMSAYEQKFITNQYKHEDQLAADILLMVNNCYLYNPADNPVYQAAKKIEKVFNKYWMKLHDTAMEAEERPKKRQKNKGRSHVTVNNDNIQASKKASTKLVIKVPVKVKDGESSRKIQLVVDAKKPSLGLNTTPSSSKATNSQDVLPASSASKIQSIANIYPSSHGNTSSSSSSMRLKLAINPNPPISVKGVSTHSGHRRTPSSSSPTSSVHDYKSGLEAYSEPSSSKSYYDHRHLSSSSSTSPTFDCNLGGDAYPVASSSKNSHYHDHRRLSSVSSSSTYSTNDAPSKAPRRSSSSSTQSMGDHKTANNPGAPLHRHSSNIEMPDNGQSVTPSTTPGYRCSSSSFTPSIGDRKETNNPAVSLRHTSNNKLSDQRQKLGPPQKSVPHLGEKVPPMPSVFDLIDKIEGEKKLRKEQAERERQEYEKRMIAEAEQERELARKREGMKKADREKRMAELNVGTIDISRQKMEMNQFERSVFHNDHDFRDLHHYYRKTNDYRTVVPPPFIHKLGLNMSHVQKNLLSIAGKFKNSLISDGSDMDMDEETGMEELD